MMAPDSGTTNGVTYKMFLERVDDQPTACLTYDASHFVLQQLHYLDFIRRYGKRIRAFHVMRLKLNESIRETVALRAHEKQAQLVALQSQLNPHFLHNMLQTIGIMAEEGSSADIQDLILNMARVLRYVSSTEGTTATLGTEMEYAESYLAAMRARFGGSLEYVIDVPRAMREIVVPRLILQPFIENCFKYGTSTRPPWRIELRGGCTDGRWMIEILDSGPGFERGTLARISERLVAREGAGNGLSPMSISGMGILNSYERLRLAFGQWIVFRDRQPARRRRTDRDRSRDQWLSGGLLSSLRRTKKG